MNISNLNTTLNTVTTQINSDTKAGGKTVAPEVNVSGNSLPVPVKAQDEKAVDNQHKSRKNSEQNESSPLVPSHEDLRELVAQANDTSLARSSRLSFSVAEDSEVQVVRIEDSETGELIRQIPSEEMLAISQALEEHMLGSILKEEV